MDDNLIEKQKQLLNSICVLHKNFLKRGVHFGWCEDSLNNLLSLTESKMGFISELLHKEDGTPFIRSHATSNIAWDPATKDFFEEQYEKGLDFGNLIAYGGQSFQKEKLSFRINPTTTLVGVITQKKVGTLS